MHINNAKHPFSLFPTTLNYFILFISLLFLTIYSVVYYFWGERIPVGNGYGWDGLVYAAYVQHFWLYISQTHDIYHVNRILPSFIIYLALKILHLSMDSSVIVVNAFIIFNSVLFILSAYLWFGICRVKQFKVTTYWLGYISLFINFLYLKHNFYDPVLTDTAAIFLGMLSLYFYVKKNYLLLALTIVPSYFTWPISILLLCPLILFPQKLNPSSAITLFERSFAFSMTLIFVSICVYLTYIVGNERIISNGVKIYYPLLPFSIFIAAYFIYSVLINSRCANNIHTLFKLNYRNAGYLIFSCAITYILFHWLAHHLPNYATAQPLFTVQDLLTVSVLGAIAKPGLFFISHLAFWGPVVVLMMWYLKDMAQQVGQNSVGLMLFMLLTLVLALNSQTRQCDFNFPFIIYLLCCVMNNKIITRQSIGYFLIAGLIVSKVYYHINNTPLTGSILDFPYQRFMMNSGTYMNWGGYFVNISLFIIAILLCYKAKLLPQPQAKDRIIYAQQ